MIEASDARVCRYDRPSKWPTHAAEVRLNDLYAELNERHFAGRLPSVPVLVGIPQDTSGHTDLNGLTRMRTRPGDSEPTSAAIYMSTWLFGETWNDRAKLQWNMIANVLIHEMVHVKVNLELLRDGSREDAHGPRFTAACNEIARSMGWDEVDAHDDECDCLITECSQAWPNADVLTERDVDQLLRTAEIAAAAA
jgi:hypothetical protein